MVGWCLALIGKGILQLPKGDLGLAAKRLATLLRRLVRGFDDTACHRLAVFIRANIDDGKTTDDLVALWTILHEFDRRNDIAGFVSLYGDLSVDGARKRGVAAWPRGFQRRNGEPRSRRIRTSRVTGRRLRCSQPCLRPSTRYPPEID
jgi:hypothetical protein